MRGRLARVAKALERVYGVHGGFYDEPSDPLSELIETMLSQNTTGTNTRRAFEAMRAAFPTWEAVMKAPRMKLERALRPAGLARTRSERIQTLLKSIMRERGVLNLDHLNEMPAGEAEQALLRFKGVGPKTALCVLLFALGRDVFPIDTHIHRILTRLGVIPEGMSVEKAHPHVLPLVPKGRHLALHLNLIAHGRKVCRPRKPRCEVCDLRRECVYARGSRESEACGNI